MSGHLGKNIHDSVSNDILFIILGGERKRRRTSVYTYLPTYEKRGKVTRRNKMKVKKFFFSIYLYNKFRDNVNNDKACVVLEGKEKIMILFQL